MMILEITPLYAMPLAILMFALWLQVVKARAARNVSIGHADDPALHEKIRRHGNFIEYVPLVLLLMLMAELRGGNDTALHGAGGLLVLSRVLHPFGLRAGNATHALRIMGNSGSLLAMFISVAVIGLTYL